MINIQFRIFPPKSGSPDWASFLESRPIGSFNGKETYENLKFMLSHYAADMASMRDNGLDMCVNGTWMHFNVVWWGGGDLKIQSIINGLGGDFKSKAMPHLPQCNCPSDRLDDLQHKCRPRTLDELCRQSHFGNGSWFWVLPGFTQENKHVFSCPCCNTHFKSLAEVEEHTKAFHSKASQKRFHKHHAGVRLLQPPLLPIEPRRVVPCTLHLFLSCVKALWKRIILTNVETTEQATLLNEMLEFQSLSMPTVALRSKLVSTDQLSTLSLTGRHAKTLLQHFNVYLSVLADTLDSQKLTNYILVKDAFFDYYNALVKLAETEQARKEKSERIATLGLNFVSLFAKHASSKDVPFYMRLIVCEIPRFTANCPLDIHLASGSAGEQVGGYSLKMIVILILH